ncbi:MAG: class I SAM-dependent methyltransferase [Thermoplasmata archaeon]
MRGTTRYDPSALRRSWELQQSYEMPSREWRFDRMLDVLSVSVPPRARILDLGCGTGSLSERILRRLPKARVWAIDYDPVILRIGREGLGRVHGRLTWLEADLRSRRWTNVLPPGRFDAAVSTTALHWLYSKTLSSVYRKLYHRLKAHGLFLNGDMMGFEPEQKQVAELARKLRQHWSEHRRQGRALGWTEWWKAARGIPELAPEFEERDRRYATTHGNKPTTLPDPSARAQILALKRAGFSEAEIIYCHLQSRVLLAAR